MLPRVAASAAGKITTKATTLFAGEAGSAELSNGEFSMTSRNDKAATDADVTRGRQPATRPSAPTAARAEARSPRPTCPARVFAPVFTLDSVPHGDGFNQLVITEPVRRDSAHPTWQGTLRLRSSLDDGAIRQTPAQGLTIARAGAGRVSATARTLTVLSPVAGTAPALRNGGIHAF
ncbi:hypothetical protein [Streptomyces europaeiscabiei]|uniref:hypothetical protein n=1 Tax=Streptomyces europaeiscabiei TaxID=146819 RepID=UPI000765D683|nr:hypothetical protein [Streptomyces europaeiscabiei]MDX2528883.1 hypothetical protein [Streptomyces europaeiscabiei]